jgi:DNA-binding transcriptional LysR family regulator
MNALPKIRQLQCFLAAVEEGSFRAAAQRLNMTQPPFSRQIRELEAVVGGPLFLRTRSGVELTERGRFFRAEAWGLMDGLQDLTDRTASLAGAGARGLRIGLTTFHDPGMFPDFRTLLAPLSGGAPVEVAYAPTGRLLRRVARGQLDLAIVGFPLPAASDLTIEPLCDEELCVALPAAHRCAAAPVLSLTDLAGDTLFWFPRSQHPAYYDRCEAVFERLGCRWQRRPEPEDHHVLLGLIANGEGFALLSRSLSVIARGGMVYRPLVAEQARDLLTTLALAYRADRNGPAEEPVYAAIRQLFRERE